MEQKRKTVLSILTTIFGDARASLSIGESRGRRGTCFFYRVKDEPYVMGLLSYLRGQCDPNSEYPFEGLRLNYYDGQSTDASRKDVAVRVKDDGEQLEIRFFTIEGVRFYRSYGKKPVAAIVPGKIPLFTLRLDETPVVYAETRSDSGPMRFNWWINKCLRNNTDVQSFVVALFEALGGEHPILRDVARAIRHDAFFLAPVRFDELLQCHTPADLIAMLFQARREQLLPVNYNRMDLNVAYYLTSFAYQFDEKSVAKLLQLPQDEVVWCIRPQDIYEGPRPERFLSTYYTLHENDPGVDPWDVRQDVADYVGMCAQMREPLRFFASYRALMRRHNELSDEISRLADEISDKPIVPADSKFEKLATDFRVFSEGAIEWITNGLRLREEGDRQHNCVYCYRSGIRADACAIFHMDRSDESYTFRIEIDHFGKYFIAEMRARFNLPYRKEDYDFVQRIVRRFNRELEGYGLPPQYNLFGEEVTDLEGWDA